MRDPSPFPLDSMSDCVFISPFLLDVKRNSRSRISDPGQTDATGHFQTHRSDPMRQQRPAARPLQGRCRSSRCRPKGPWHRLGPAARHRGRARRPASHLLSRTRSGRLRRAGRTARNAVTEAVLNAGRRGRKEFEPPRASGPGGHRRPRGRAGLPANRGQSEAPAGAGDERTCDRSGARSQRQDDR